MSEQKQIQEAEKTMSFMTLVVITGLFAGIFWSALGYVAYIFHLTSVHPRVILEPWAIGSWKKEWLGTLISFALIGGMSIIAALIYYVTLRKFNSMWIGVAYGLVLFAIVFLLLNPLFESIKPWRQMTLNTMITSACLYVLYGLFVGYTICYEENENRKAKKKKEAVTPS